MGLQRGIEDTLYTLKELMILLQKQDIQMK